MSETVFITQGEATQRLNLSNRSFYNLVEAGVIRKRRLMGMRYGKYLREDILRLEREGLPAMPGREGVIERFLQTLKSEQRKTA
jgi:hypothetical protein